jgi:hypothetical protein
MPERAEREYDSRQRGGSLEYHYPHYPLAFLPWSKHSENAPSLHGMINA